MNKKQITTVAAVAGVITMGGAIFLPLSVQAWRGSGNDSGFAAELAERLDLDESQISEAIQSIKDERQLEREAEIQSIIMESVSNGEITERQAELLQAIREVREELHEDQEFLSPEDRSQLTEEDRELLKEQREAAILDALNERELDVTSSELEELREIMNELGFGRKGGHHRG
jgi:DNA-binding MarR family transcriptional regulator